MSIVSKLEEEVRDQEYEAIAPWLFDHYRAGSLATAIDQLKGELRARITALNYALGGYDQVRLLIDEMMPAPDHASFGKPHLVINNDQPAA